MKTTQIEFLPSYLRRASLGELVNIAARYGLTLKARWCGDRLAVYMAEAGS